MTTYIKILPEHVGDPRWLDAGPAAFTVHIWALVHCNQQLTDGRISKLAAERIALPVPIEETRPAIDRLLATGLWNEDGEHYVIEGYDTYALGSDEITAVRKRWAVDRRRRRKHAAGTHDECSPDRCAAVRGGHLESPGRTPGRTSAMSGGLDQTRPDQTHKGSGSGRPSGDETSDASEQDHKCKGGRPDCVGGWLGDDDHPRPCPDCRPKTAKTLRQQQRNRDRRRGIA